MDTCLEFIDKRIADSKKSKNSNLLLAASILVSIVVGILAQTDLVLDIFLKDNENLQTIKNITTLASIIPTALLGKVSFESSKDSKDQPDYELMKNILQEDHDKYCEQLKEAIMSGKIK